ncbi:response regulator [Methylobacterium nigriterrae]|uniref:response regulator n=1 Tax=Methylobacterium nigriterrae TaxID=3127512 RepID=UPI0030133983
MSGSACPADLNRARVLVVEDEFFLADDLARTLARFGADVVGPVASVGEALDIVASEALDAVVLDINLQGEMAYPILDALQARGTPLVIATGYDRGEIPSAYAQLPRWEKPFSYDALVATLPALMRRGGSGD